MFKEWLGGDYTPIEHGVVAVILQLFAIGANYPLWGFHPYLIVLSSFFGVAIFIGREHAQAEMRIKSERKSKELSWDITLDALKIWKWDRASFMDLFIPVLCNAVVAAGFLLFI